MAGFTYLLQGNELIYLNEVISVLREDHNLPPGTCN